MKTQRVTTKGRYTQCERVTKVTVKNRVVTGVTKYAVFDVITEVKIMQIVGDFKINNDSSVMNVVTALIDSGYNVNVMPCKKKKRVRLVITTKESEDK